MKGLLEWLLGVVSVLLGIAGLYRLSILPGSSLGTSETEGQLSHYGDYLLFTGLPSS